MSGGYLLPPVRSCGRYTVRPGDTLEGICIAHGRPGWAYDELVSANLAALAPRGFSGTHSPPGLGYKAPIMVGDVLRVPRHWQRTCKPCGVQLPAPSAVGAPVSAQDVQEIFAQYGKSQAEEVALDPTSIQLLELVGQAMDGWQSPPGPGALPEAWRPGFSNAVTSWWRRAYPNDTPTRPKIKRITDSAAAFMAQIGQGLKAPENIPWGRLNLDTIAAAADVLRAAIDWEKVRLWIFKNVPVEKVSGDKIEALPAWLDMPEFWAKESTKALPWEQIASSGIPFHLLPLGKMDLKATRAAMAQSRDVTGPFLQALGDALGVQVAAEDVRPPGPITYNGGKTGHPSAAPAPVVRKGFTTGEKFAIGAAVAAAAVGAAVVAKKAKVW